MSFRKKGLSRPNLGVSRRKVSDSSLSKDDAPNIKKEDPVKTNFTETVEEENVAKISNPLPGGTKLSKRLKIGPKITSRLVTNNKNSRNDKVIEIKELENDIEDKKCKQEEKIQTVSASNKIESKDLVKDNKNSRNDKIIEIKELENDKTQTLLASNKVEIKDLESDNKQTHDVLVSNTASVETKEMVENNNLDERTCTDKSVIDIPMASNSKLQKRKRIAPKLIIPKRESRKSHPTDQVIPDVVTSLDKSTESCNTLQNRNTLENTVDINSKEILVDTSLNKSIEKQNNANETIMHKQTHLSQKLLENSEPFEKPTIVRHESNKTTNENNKADNYNNSLQVEDDIELLSKKNTRHVHFKKTSALPVKGESSKYKDLEMLSEICALENSTSNKVKKSSLKKDVDYSSQSEGESSHSITGLSRNKKVFKPNLGARRRKRLSSFSAYSSCDEEELQAEEIKKKAKDDENVEGTTKVKKMKLTKAETNDAKENSAQSKRKKGRTKKKKNKEDKSSSEDEEGSITTMKKPRKMTRVCTEERDISMLTMQELIHYRPKSLKKVELRLKKGLDNDIEETTVIPAAITELEENKDVKIKKNMEEGAGDDDDVMAPQVMLDENGHLVINEKSLFIRKKVDDSVLKRSGVLYEDALTTNNHRRRTSRVKRWKMDETLRFYKALSQIGTDFTLMSQAFGRFTRNELKKKFKQEEKINCDLVDLALSNRLPLNMEVFLRGKAEKDLLEQEEEMKNMEAGGDIESTSSPSQQQQSENPDIENNNSSTIINDDNQLPTDTFIDNDVEQVVAEKENLNGEVNHCDGETIVGEKDSSIRDADDDSVLNFPSYKGKKNKRLKIIDDEE